MAGYRKIPTIIRYLSLTDASHRTDVPIEYLKDLIYQGKVTPWIEGKNINRAWMESPVSLFTGAGKLVERQENLTRFNAILSDTEIFATTDKEQAIWIWANSKLLKWECNGYEAVFPLSDDDVEGAVIHGGDVVADLDISGLCRILTHDSEGYSFDNLTITESVQSIRARLSFPDDTEVDVNAGYLVDRFGEAESDRIYTLLDDAFCVDGFQADISISESDILLTPQDINKAVDLLNGEESTAEDAGKPAVSEKQDGTKKPRTSRTTIRLEVMAQITLVWHQMLMDGKNPTEKDIEAIGKAQENFGYGFPSHDPINRFLNAMNGVIGKKIDTDRKADL